MGLLCRDGRSPPYVELLAELADAVGLLCGEIGFFPGVADNVVELGLGVGEVARAEGRGKCGVLTVGLDYRETI